MEHIIRIPTKTLMVLCGPVRSGRSTFAAQHFTTTQVVSPDCYWARGRDRARNFHINRDTFDLFHLSMQKRLKLDRLTVADSTAFLVFRDALAATWQDMVHEHSLWVRARRQQEHGGKADRRVLISPPPRREVPACPSGAVMGSSSQALKALIRLVAPMQRERRQQRKHRALSYSYSRFQYSHR